MLEGNESVAFEHFLNPDLENTVPDAFLEYRKFVCWTVFLDLDRGLKLETSCTHENENDVRSYEYWLEWAALSVS
jgi:hypothetical protein